MSKKQTAVEWLIEKHFGGVENVTPFFQKNIEEAKEIEKQQIIDAYYNGTTDEIKAKDKLLFEAEHYYNERYGGNK